MNLVIKVDPRVGDVEAVRIGLEIEDALGHERDVLTEFEELEEGVDVSVTLNDVPGTYPEFEQKVKNVLEGLVPPERIRVTVNSSSDEWE